MTHPIPEAALAQHVAILGKTGSGKSSTAKLAIEQVSDDFRVCVLDPVKSDWWGITSSADGRSPGLQFKILGGPHGHVPLHSSAGKVIGQLVGSGALTHSVIDMADFEAGGIQRFFVDFAQALWKNQRGVLYLVIEEAHEFAPKERAGFGAENMAIHWAKKLATGSRTKGIHLIVATQRIQSLHNAVLGSCDSLIAHRIGTPADQEPVIKWLRANVQDKALRTEVEASLSRLPTGTGWLCSGEAQIFEKIAFPRIATFDNTATPTKDSAAIEITTAPVDVNELRGLIGTAVAEAEANDVGALKAKIATLTEQVATLSTRALDAGTSPAVQQALRDAEARGRERGLAEAEPSLDMAHVDGFEKGKAAALATVEGSLGGIAPAFAKTAELIAKEIQGTAEWVEGEFRALLVNGLAAPAPRKKVDWSTEPNPRHGYTALSDDQRPISQSRPFQPDRSSPPNVVAAHSNAKGERAILNALAWWRVAGHAAPTMAQVGFVAGYRHTSSTFEAYRSRLKTRALIEYPEPGRLRLTDEGNRVAVAPPRAPSMPEYHDRVRRLLAGPLQKFFDALIGRKTLTSEQLGEATGYRSTSSTFEAYRSRMKTLDLITYPEPGKVRIADWLWP